MKTKEELNTIREAQKRLSWIDNVKRIYNWDQERAEAEWTNIQAQKKMIDEDNETRKDDFHQKLP